MALAHWQRTFVNDAGDILPSLLVTIRDESTGEIAEIYSDVYGDEDKPNPFATDEFGYANFYAVAGEYRIQATGVDWRNVSIMSLSTVEQTVSEAISGLTNEGKDINVTPSNGSESRKLGGWLDSFAATFDAVTPHPVDGRDPSLTYLTDAPWLYIGQTCRVLGRYKPGDGGHGDYEIVNAGTGGNYGFLYEQLVESGLEAKFIDGGVMEDKTVYVPSDYPDIQAAIDKLSAIKSSNDAIISIVIESGYTITTQTFAKGVNLSNVRITAEDSTVMVSQASLSGFGKPDSRFFYIPTMGFVGGYTPIIDAVFELNTDGPTLSGMETILCVAEIKSGAGFVGRFHRNFIGVTSVVHAMGTVWHDSHYRAVSMLRGSQGDFEGADCRRAGVGTPSTPRGMFVSWSSIVNFDDGRADNSGGEGVAAFANSHVSFRDGSATSVSTRATRAVNGSSINARDADLRFAGVYSCDVTCGASINAWGAQIGSLSQGRNTLTEHGVIYNDVYSFAPGEESGSFDAEISGTNEPGTTTVVYAKNGRLVSMRILAFSLPSGHNYLRLTGLPESIRILGSRTGRTEISVLDNDQVVRGQVDITDNAQIVFRIDGSSTGFSANGNKGLPWDIQFTYNLF